MVYPIPEMNVRAITALIMGLLLQWSMMGALPAANPAGSCGAEAASMSCCAPDKPCPCLKNQENPGKRQDPLAPKAPDLKSVFTLTSSTDDGVSALAAPTPSRSTPHARAGSTAGFPGVPLSVAFCSFVI